MPDFLNNDRKIGSNVVIALAMTISSTLFLTKLGFSPVYPLTIIFASLIILIQKQKYNYSQATFLVICTLFTLLTLSSNILKFGDSPFLFPILVNLLLSPLVMMACFTSFARLSPTQLSIVVYWFVWFVIFIGGVDTLWKLKNPLINPMYEIEGSEIWFYKYKNSLMFGDSNGTSILLLTTLGAYFALAHLKAIELKHHVVIILFLLIVFTLSRAAIISSLICLALFYFPKNRALLVLFSLAFISIFSYLIPTAIMAFKNDGSGITKINELFHIMDFIKSSSLPHLFFGVGYGLGEEVTGRYIHGILPKLIIEGGILSFLLFTLFVVLAIFYMSSSVFLFVPLLVCSISLSLYIVVPFQVVSFCLIFHANNLRRLHRHAK